MKKILITGKGSYIGTSFKNYLEQFPDEYHADELDMKSETWREFDFSRYDIVFHVAGIAHMKEKKKNEVSYYAINRDLAFEVAKKAKKDGIKQFVFMSSMSVYGLSCSNDPITFHTKTNPKTFYGKSKLEAEILITELIDTSFKVCILRPPMVYGDNSPGNLTSLFNLVRKIHIFPTIENKRSSITVKKLNESVKFYIDSECTGIYFPQNSEYLCTYDIVKKQMKKEKIIVLYTSIFNPLIKMLIGKVSVITKCFGDLIYEK